MERFSLEVKVGLVVVMAGAMVLAFVFILGDWNPFTNTYRITMKLQYAGGIKPGSDVHLAGAKVGKVDSIRYLAVNKDDEGAPIVGLELLIDKRAQALIREDSTFVVQMESLLGGKMVEISPGSPDKMVLPDKAEVRGDDPPKLEALMNEGISMLEGIQEFMAQLTPEDKARMRELLVTLSRFGPEDVDDVRRALNNAADISDDLKVIVADVKPDVKPMITDARAALEQVNPLLHDLRMIMLEVEPTLIEARDLVRKLDRTVTDLRGMLPADTAATRAKVEEILDMADDLKEIMGRLEGFTAFMEQEFEGVDREELERWIRLFLQQEGVTINLRKLFTDPGYPPPPGMKDYQSPWDKNKDEDKKLPWAKPEY